MGEETGGEENAKLTGPKRARDLPKRVRKDRKTGRMRKVKGRREKKMEEEKVRWQG